MRTGQRRIVIAWLVVDLVVLVLYTCVPSVLFNDGTERIAGMPAMLFWFTLLPFLVPALMGALYLYDRGLPSRPDAADGDADGRRT